MSFPPFPLLPGVSPINAKDVIAAALRVDDKHLTDEEIRQALHERALNQIETVNLSHLSRCDECALRTPMLWPKPS